MADETAIESPIPPHADVQRRIRTTTDEADFATLVVSRLADAIINERVEKLIKAFAKYRTAQSEVNKARKPDLPMTLKEDGSELTPASFSPAQIKKIEEAKGKLKKIAEVIDKAIKSKDFSGLDKILGD